MIINHEMIGAQENTLGNLMACHQDLHKKSKLILIKALLLKKCSCLNLNQKLIGDDALKSYYKMKNMTKTL